MRVVSNKALVAFAAIHPASGAPLQAWRKALEARDFTHFADLKRGFNTVDRVGDVYVFDIGGNTYRIVAAIHCNRRQVFVRYVFTHKDYAAWKP